MQKQTTLVKKEDLQHAWYIVDASTMPLGRLASLIAVTLMGKHKATYSSNLDNGDYVIVINASKAVLTGNKRKTKVIYTQTSQQPGGLRSRTAETMLEKYPEELVTHAVKGMLPKNSRGELMLKKLRVFAGETHDHTAQNPLPLPLIKSEVK